MTGAGRAFCAGADLTRGAATFDYSSDGEPDWADPANRDTGGRVSLRIFNSVKPVIAAINGSAVGVGITMTLPMDIRLVAAGAKTGFVFARRGIVPEAASSWFLARLVGPQRALEWCLTGRLLSAEEADAGGLARSVHPPDELLPAAPAMAREIAEAAPVSAVLARRMIWRGLTDAHPMAAHRIESRWVAARGRGPDEAEGVTSFLEKRAPDRPGRVPADLPPGWSWWTDPPLTEEG